MATRTDKPRAGSGKSGGEIRGSQFSSDGGSTWSSGRESERCGGGYLGFSRTCECDGCEYGRHQYEVWGPRRLSIVTDATAVAAPAAATATCAFSPPSHAHSSWDRHLARTPEYWASRKDDVSCPCGRVGPTPSQDARAPALVKILHGYQQPDGTIAFHHYSKCWTGQWVLQ